MNANDPASDDREKPDPYLMDLTDENAPLPITLPWEPSPNELANQLRSVGSAVRLPEVPGYELLGELGRGGMGVVYKARQVRLNRMVALKMILGADCVDAESLARFQREAEAVAKLQHPNIVPIYEIGDHDGRPFFSLEFVEGGSLDRLVSGQPFPSRDVAGLVETIARAMDFAHERGIMHRDLKPANILLQRAPSTSATATRAASTKEHVQAGLSTLRLEPHPSVPKLAVRVGPALRPSLADFVPKITDFGLAKQLDGDGTATRSGAVMGTPGFMAPEQAAGRTHEIGPLADVYGLGAILYNLLTGRPPFRAESDVLTLQLVIDTEPVAPRLLHPALDRDLETICLKCLEKDPQRRYTSALGIADDLRRYQHGEPIHARPISAPARAWRYCKRRPLVSSFAALFVLAMLVGTSVSTFFGVLANNRATLAEDRRLKLESSNSQLTVANETAESRRIAAEEAATVAREQSQLALKSLESVIFDIERGLINIPGAGEVRRKLLQTALARLQEVSDQFASRAAIDRNTMVALHDLGDVFLRIGSGSRTAFQAVPAQPEGLETHPTDDGPLAAARKVYQQAFDIAQKLTAADPSDGRAQRDLSISYNKLGHVSLQAGQVTEALVYYQKCLKICQKRAEADPNDAQAQRELSTSIERVGFIYERSGKLTEAREQYEQMLSIKKRLAENDPADSLAQHELSVTYGHLGDVQLQSEQVTDALKSFQKGLEIDQKLVATDPNNATAQRSLFISYIKLGDALRQSEQSSMWRSLRNFLTQRLDGVLIQSGQVTDALGCYQKGLEISQKLAAADPSDTQAQRELSASYEKLGYMLLQSGRVTEALGHYQKCLEISQKRAAVDPTDAEAQRDLSISYDNLGDVQRQSVQATEALVSFQKGLVIRQKLAAADPSDAQAQFDLVVSFVKLGSVEQMAKQHEQAIETYGRGLKVLQSLKEQKRLAAENEKWIGIVEEAIAECRKLMGGSRE